MTGRARPRDESAKGCDGPPDEELDGPSSPNEDLTVSRAVDAPGVGQSFPSGTVVTEQNAIDLVRVVKSERGALP